MFYQKVSCLVWLEGNYSRIDINSTKAAFIALLVQDVRLKWVFHRDDQMAFDHRQQTSLFSTIWMILEYLLNAST